MRCVKFWRTASLSVCANNSTQPGSRSRSPRRRELPLHRLFSMQRNTPPFFLFIQTGRISLALSTTPQYVCIWSWFL
jgi:hypothetical protein